MLPRSQALGDRVYPESQCGFRAHRSTVDMIFSLRQLQEKCREQYNPLCIDFIDLTKVFDLMSRDGLLLKRIGCPPTLLRILIAFHENQHCTIIADGDRSKPFKVSNGVKQSCMFAKTLFKIFFSSVLAFAFQDSSKGIYLHTRSDGKLCNLRRLCAKAKVRKFLTRELLFADYAALVAHKEHELQLIQKAWLQRWTRTARLVDNSTSYAKKYQRPS